MPKVIEDDKINVKYENGVFRPKKKLDIPDKSLVTIKLIKIRGNLTKKDVSEIKKILKDLPKSKIDFEKLGEIYHEGKMFG